MFFEVLPQMVVTGLLLAAIYILIATGFNLAFGIMRMVNFAYGATYMLGGYAVFVAMNILGLNYFLGLAIAVAFTFLLGWLCEFLLLRGRVRDDMLAGIIITLGLLYVFQSGALLIFGEHPQGVDAPITGVVHIAGVVFQMEKLLPAILCVVFIGGLYMFLRFTKTGQSLRAVTDDRDAGALMGIRINRVYGVGFAIGMALAGAAGALIAPVFLIDSAMGGAPLWKCFIVVLLGGMGSVPGGVLAGLFLGLVDSFVGTLLSGTLASIIGFVAIILVLMFRPEGFMGQKMEL